MTIKLRSIVHAVSALSKVSTGDLSLHLAYRLKKMMNALQKEADFFSEQRIKIFEKYGTAGEDGNYHFEGENETKAINDLDDLLDMEVTPDVEVIDIPITEKLCISVNDITLLMPFIHFIEE